MKNKEKKVSKRWKMTFALAFVYVIGTAVGMEYWSLSHHLFGTVQAASLAGIFSFCVLAFAFGILGSETARNTRETEKEKAKKA